MPALNRELAADLVERPVREQTIPFDKKRCESTSATRFATARPLKPDLVPRTLTGTTRSRTPCRMEERKSTIRPDHTGLEVETFGRTLDSGAGEVRGSGRRKTRDSLTELTGRSANHDPPCTPTRPASTCQRRRSWTGSPRPARDPGRTATVERRGSSRREPGTPSRTVRRSSTSLPRPSAPPAPHTTCPPATSKYSSSSQPVTPTRKSAKRSTGQP